MNEIRWKLDESNNIVFKINISSSEPLNTKPNIRLVCEASDVNFIFNGKLNENSEAEVTIPPMKGRLIEGKYHAKLETILDDKYFVPLEFDAVFEMSTSVVAEISHEKDKKNLIENKIEAFIVPKEPKKQLETRIKTKEKPPTSTNFKIRSLKETFKNKK